MTHYDSNELRTQLAKCVDTIHTPGNEYVLARLRGIIKDRRRSDVYTLACLILQPPVTSVDNGRMVTRSMAREQKSIANNGRHAEIFNIVTRILAGCPLSRDEGRKAILMDGILMNAVSVALRTHEVGKKELSAMVDDKYTIPLVTRGMEMTIGGLQLYYRGSPPQNSIQAILQSIRRLEASGWPDSAAFAPYLHTLLKTAA